jgi:hypothetical protein
MVKIAGRSAVAHVELNNEGTKEMVLTNHCLVGFCLKAHKILQRRSYYAF